MKKFYWTRIYDFYEVIPLNWASFSEIEKWGGVQTSEKIYARIVQVSAKFFDTTVEIYLIRGERNILIDTGIHQSPGKDILPILKVNGLTLSDIHLILNTHDHPDHTGGNSAIKAPGGSNIHS